MLVADVTGLAKEHGVLADVHGKIADALDGTGRYKVTDRLLHQRTDHIPACQLELDVEYPSRFLKAAP